MVAEFLLLDRLFTRSGYCGLGTADQLLGELDQTRSPHANIEPGQMDRLPNGEFRLTDGPNRLPHSYTLQAINP